MASLFLTFRAVHMTCAGLSIAGFVLRWIWMLTDSRLLAARPTRIVPHIVDTLLLASAIALVAIIVFAFIASVARTHDPAGFLRAIA